MADPLGFKKVVPAYWGYCRRLLAWAAIAMLPWLAFVLAGLVGLPTPGWVRMTVMLATYAVLGWLIFGLPFRQRRAIVRAVNHAGDLGRVCSKCLYISDAIAEGDPCPECGTPHPPDLGAKWIFTGHKLNDQYLFKRLVRESTVLTESSEAPPIACEEAPGPPD